MTVTPPVPRPPLPDHARRTQPATNGLPDTAVFAALFAGALAIRVGAILWWAFDGLYGQDPFAYLEQARALAAAVPHGQWRQRSSSGRAGIH